MILNSKNGVRFFVISSLLMGLSACDSGSGNFAAPINPGTAQQRGGHDPAPIASASSVPAPQNDENQSLGCYEVKPTCQNLGTSTGNINILLSTTTNDNQIKINAALDYSDDYSTSKMTITLTDEKSGRSRSETYTINDQEVINGEVGEFKGSDGTSYTVDCYGSHLGVGETASSVPTVCEGKM